MAWSFNVFTGNLDLTGSSGAVVFEGEEETFDDLPVGIGDPPVGSSYLVRTSTGVWLVNRRQAGIWIRRNNTGVRATDWEYGGDYPVNSVNGQTGNISLTAADVGASATGHTHAAADVTSGTFDNARINFAAPSSIGNTTPAAGTFTTLAANSGTLTASAPVLDLAQTWNNAAVTFTGLRFNATNTVSATTSLIADWQVNGSSMFYVRRDGRTIGAGGVYGANGLEAGLVSQGVVAGSAAYIGLCSATTATDATCDTRLFRDAADTLAQRRGANGQTFRLYNTYTDASNHERLSLRWASNVAIIGTEAAGTGSARDIEFQHGGTTRFSLIGNTIRFATTNVALHWANATMLRCFSNGNLTITTSNQLDFGLLQFGGTTNLFPALKRSSTTLQVRLANDSAFAPFECAGLTLNGNLDASTRDIVTDTTTGTKIGTGTTQKLGFFNATPVVQQAAVADATDAASTQARLNDLLARVRTLGLIAT